jgi:hypothetical protein
MNLMDFDLERFCTFAENCGFIAELTMNKNVLGTKIQTFLNYVYKV